MSYERSFKIEPEVHSTHHELVDIDIPAYIVEVEWVEQCRD